MTSIVSNKLEQVQNVDQVPQAPFSSQAEISLLSENVLHIEKVLLTLESNVSQIRAECDTLTNSMLTTLNSIKLSHKNSLEQLQNINKDRLEIIKEQRKVIMTHKDSLEQLQNINQERLEIIKKQKMAIAAYRLASFRQRLKDFFKPRIGNLAQYQPRTLDIQEHYHKKPSLKNTPKISIVTPAFNHGRFIEKTILSVINQNYPSLEYIIQDGGSLDNTIDCIKRYQHALTHWESKEDKGQANALNIGFQHVSGDIMGYLNSDDILLPGTLHAVAHYFNQHPDVDVIYGHRILINENEQEVGRWILPPHDNKVLIWADYIPQETLFWRKRIWEKVGARFDESFKFALDWDLLLRFRQAGAKFARLPRFLGAFRVHSDQKTLVEISQNGANEMERLRMRCHGRAVSEMEIKKNLLFYLFKHFIVHKLYRLGVFRY